MRPFRPGHVYFELTESFNNLSRTAIIVHIERLKDFPIVVEITDEMRSGDVPIVIGQQVAQHFAGIHKPVDDHIQLGEE